MTGLAIAAAVLVAYALVSARLERVWVTGPIVFVAAGTLLGSGVTDLLPAEFDNETTLAVTELTLALLLFADASTLRLSQVRHDAGLPVRLLLIGLPLTMVLGTLAAVSILPVGWAAAAVIATILAPTDAALGAVVVTNRIVPVRIRRALNVESGLNDGIATPFVMLFITLLVAEEGDEQGNWAVNALTEIGLALVAAVVVGGLGGLLVLAAHRRGWTTTVSRQFAVLGLALLSYECAVAIGGNGFVAAFVGGLVFGASTARHLLHSVEFTETTGLLASYVVWIVFGAFFVSPLFGENLTLAPIVFAVLSLTVVRMLPVAVSLAGVGMRRDTLAFVGWFGPRGLASVVFMMIALESLHHEGSAAETITSAVTWTILLSVLAHGLTASPLSAAYGRRMSGLVEIPELVGGPEPRTRRRSLAEASAPPSPMPGDDPAMPTTRS